MIGPAGPHRSRKSVSTRLGQAPHCPSKQGGGHGATIGCTRPATRMARSHGGAARSHTPEHWSLVTAGRRQRHGRVSHGRGASRGSEVGSQSAQASGTPLDRAGTATGQESKLTAATGIAATRRTAGPATVRKNRAPGKAPRATTPETRVHRQLEVTLGPCGHSPGESVAEAAGAAGSLGPPTQAHRPDPPQHPSRSGAASGRPPGLGRDRCQNIPSLDCKGRRDHRGVRCSSVQSRSGLGTGRCLRRFGGGRPGRPEDQKYLKN